MAERIARIEQFLAASGLSVPAGSPGAVGSGADVGAGSGAVFDAVPAPGAAFDAVPASFGAPPSFSNPDQIAAASAGLSPFSPPQPGVVPEDILFLARSGKKIQAIAEYRRRTGVSLKEAKNIIDQVGPGY